MSFSDFFRKKSFMQSNASNTSIATQASAHKQTKKQTSRTGQASQQQKP
jgi:hypothetical protein